VRIHLRDLVKFIDRKQQRIVITDFQDTLGEIREVNVPHRQTGFSPYQYKRNAALTESDLESLEQMLFGAQEIESRDRFEEVYGKNLSLKLFIRKLVGLDRNEAKQAFATYRENGNFSANQIHFVENIIDYLTQNGVIDPGLLYEAPFTDSHPEGLDGVFTDDEADQIISLVRSFNETVEAEFGAA
jgi:type I restriction enzyme R subunit